MFSKLASPHNSSYFTSSHMFPSFHLSPKALTSSPLPHFTYINFQSFHYFTSPHIFLANLPLPSFFFFFLLSICASIHRRPEKAHLWRPPKHSPQTYLGTAVPYPTDDAPGTVTSPLSLSLLAMYKKELGLTCRICTA